MQLFNRYRALSRGITACNTVIGQSLAWLTVAMVIITAAIVVARAAFNAGSVGSQELVTYLHAIVIMGASAYTLANNEHVRVDIFYRRLNPQQQAWVDLVGSLLLLLPFALVTALISWNFVMNAWALRETSADSGGLPFVYLLKSLLLVNGVLLALQALADAMRHLVTIAQGDVNHQKDAKPKENQHA
ncbi:MAG: TRAP transporter small permease subunit [Marinagarivorans sp.]|nr:TRAP transporter small permease subunit [Marinagarivorans sp.]